MTDVKRNSYDWLLIANGAPLSSSKLRELAQDKSVMVLDGAYKFASQSGLNIDVLLGDFDSINAEDLTHARKTVTRIIHAPNQNKTDLEKGLNYIDEMNATSIYICAAIGRRLQHTLYNLRILKKYHQPHRPLIMISDIEVIRYYQDTEINISGKINDCIALLGFPHAAITTSGLKYDVTDYELHFEKCNSISNALAQTHANIKIRGGALLIHELVNEEIFCLNEL